MEDAATRLEGIAEDVAACRRCTELLEGRVRAVPGGGHPHAHLMVVVAHPSETDESAGRPAGTSLIEGLTDVFPGFDESSDSDVYVTALVKCVPRSRASLVSLSTESAVRASPSSPRRSRPSPLTSFCPSDARPRRSSCSASRTGRPRLTAAGHPRAREPGVPGRAARLAGRDRRAAREGAAAVHRAAAIARRQDRHVTRFRARRTRPGAVCSSGWLNEIASDVATCRDDPHGLSTPGSSGL